MLLLYVAKKSKRLKSIRATSNLDASHNLPIDSHPAHPLYIKIHSTLHIGVNDPGISMILGNTLILFVPKNMTSI